MALVKCPDCGRDVSDKAPTCPNCGRPMADSRVMDTRVHGRGEGLFMKSLNVGCAFILIILVLAIIMIAVAQG